MPSAITERLGITLERLGKSLQSDQEVSLKIPLQPKDAALELWQTIAPGRKPSAITSAFVRFIFWKDGVSPNNPEEEQFTQLLQPYTRLAMIREVSDVFTASLSIRSNETADVSFKLTILSPSEFPYGKPLPVLVARELPEQRYHKHTYPYNMLILGLGENVESAHGLNQRLTGFNSENGNFDWEQLGDRWPDEVAGNIEWQKRLIISALQFLTRVANSAEPEEITIYDKKIQTLFRNREQKRGWWDRLWNERFQPGAVINDSFAVQSRRTHSLSSKKLVELFSYPYP